MAKLQIIHCEDCGAPRATRYANTKYCEICRLIRNLHFVSDRKQKCLVCENRFAPIKRNQTVSLECDPYSTPGGPTGVCGVCREEDQRLYGEQIRVCVKCMDDPTKRDVIYASLLRKQKEIKDGDWIVPTPNVTGTEAQGAWGAEAS